MTAMEIIEAASAEGLVVDLSPTGSIKAFGEQEVVNRWQSLLKQHKAEIIGLLCTVQDCESQATRQRIPCWCLPGCIGLEYIFLPKEGEIAGCVNPFTDSWCRLDLRDRCVALSIGNPKEY